MKFAVALLAALGAGTLSASAHEADRVFIRHGGPAMQVDANHDGWVTRAEAAAAADRAFDELDSNHDGRLTPVDHGTLGADFDVELDGSGDVPPLPDESRCSRSVQHTNHGDRVTITCADEDVDEHSAPRAQVGSEHVERHVIIRRSEGGTPAPETVPLPPRPPHPPMFVMMLASSDEADRNGDGALSREEFRAQQLRFFDASDANGDGRVRFEPPEPPTPPAPPVAPTPPPPPR